MHFSFRRTIQGLFLTLGVIAVITPTVLGATASAAAGAVKTSSVLGATRTAITAQTSAHEVFVARSSASSVVEKIVADVAGTIGSETVSEGKAHLAVKVTATAGYIKGNQTGLTDLYGLTAAQAKKAGSAWVSWKSGTKQYTNLRSDVTVKSLTAVLPKAAGTKLTTVTTHGRKLYVLAWTSAATSSVPKLSNTLTISASGTSLPTKETATDSGGVKVTTTLSKWGEEVVVHDPPVASTIASSKITG